MTADEFDSLQRGDVVHCDSDGALGMIRRRGAKSVNILWEDKVVSDESAEDASHMTIVSRASSKAAQ